MRADAGGASVFLNEAGEPTLCNDVLLVRPAAADDAHRRVPQLLFDPSARRHILRPPQALRPSERIHRATASSILRLPDLGFGRDLRRSRPSSPGDWDVGAEGLGSCHRGSVAQPEPQHRGAVHARIVEDGLESSPYLQPLKIIVEDGACQSDAASKLGDDQDLRAFMNEIWRGRHLRYGEGMDDRVAGDIHPIRIARPAA